MAEHEQWNAIVNEVKERHNRFDRQIAAWHNGFSCMGGKLFCGKGCHNCCSLTVHATFPEVIEIAASLTDAQESRLRDHVSLMLREVSQATDLLSWLRRYRRQIGCCPFLDDDGACGVYSVRPASCRALLATQASRWCGADFTTIPADEKQAYMASLDRTVAAFPLHYVAATQEWGKELENDLCTTMVQQFSFSISGNLPYLVWLEREHRLSKTICQGRHQTITLLEQHEYIHPLLVFIDS